MSVDYKQMATALARRYGVPPETFLRLVEQESGWNPNATSPVGAYGLTQVMPETAANPGYGVAPLKDPKNPAEQLRFGAEYMGKMIQNYGGDVNRALAAYNWGPGNANKWDGSMESLPAETRNYVSAVGGGERFAQAVSAPRTKETDAIADSLIDGKLSGMGNARAMGNAPDTNDIADDIVNKMLGTVPPPSRDQALEEKADREKGIPRQAYEAARDLIMGTNEIDAPEIEMSTHTLPKEMQAKAYLMNGDLFYADSEAAMGDIVKKHFPEAEVFPDSKGNLYVRMPGVEGVFALDRSGISGRDIKDFLKGGLMAAGAVGGATVGGMFGPFFRYIGAGIGAAGESAGEQLASKWAGSKQDFDTGRVLISGAFGVGGEASASIISAIGPKLWKALMGARDAAGGNLQKYVQILKDAGVEPVEAERRIRDALSGVDVADLDGAALERIAQAQSLPVPIRLTTGQATRDPALMRQEQIARETTTAFGPETQKLALQTYKDQQAQLFENTRAFKRQVGGASDVGEAGSDVQDALVSARKADRAGVTANYNAAKDAANQPIVSAPEIAGFAVDMIDLIETKYSVPSTPLARDLIMDLADKLKPKKTPGGTVTPKGLDIRTLEDWRSKVSREMRGLDPGTDKTALLDILRAYDDASMAELKRAVIAGDEETINLWRRAVKSRKDFGKRWENEDIIDAISRTAKKGRRGELDIDAADVIAEIIGRETLGSKKGVAREVKRLKEFFIEDPEQFGKIKGEAIVKLLGFEPGGEPLEKVGTRFVANFANAMRKHPALMGELFEPGEIAALRAFARTMDNINTHPTFSASNASGSGFTAIEGAAPVVSRAITWLGRQLGIGGEIAGRYLSSKVENVGRGRAEEALRRSLVGQSLGPRRGVIPAGAGGALGAAVAPQYSE